MQAKLHLQSIAGVMILAFLVACQPPVVETISTDATPSASNMESDSPLVTVTAQQSWVIFSAEQAEKMGLASWLTGNDGFWTPATDDVSRLEEGITGYLSQNAHAFFRQPPVWERLGEYQRQYAGLEREGRYIIYGNYFCRPSMDWRQRWVAVMDGGDCYFQVEYDVESESFIMLMVNGEA